MDNTEGIVLLIGMLIVFIGIPTYCIFCRDKNDKNNENYKNDTYSQLKSSTTEKFIEA
jgi:hypothetical protein